MAEGIVEYGAGPVNIVMIVELSDAKVNNPASILPTHSIRRPNGLAGPMQPPTNAV